jgi:uncharacterized repeat protein (TIGR01451 family)
MNWPTGVQYANLMSQNIYSGQSGINQFEGYMPNMQQSIQRSRYLNPSTNQPYSINNNVNFQSKIGLFCKGKVELLANSNPILVTGEYTGQPSLTYSYTFPSSPTTVSLASKLTMLDCFTSGRSMLVPPPACANYESIWLYENNTFPASANSTPASITVKNPFSCSLVQFAPQSLPSGTVTPGQQLSFSISITNPTTNGEAAKVTSVSTSGWSPQPSPQPQPYNVNVPLTIPNNNAPYTLSGKIDAPTQPNTYTFNLVVNYQSAIEDCHANGTINCPPKVYPITITVQSTAQPDYIPILSAPLQVQANSQFTANVTTKNIGSGAAGTSTTTRLQFRNTVNNIGVAALPPQGTQNDSRNYTCPSTLGLYELNATVDYNGQLNESNENNNFASMTVNCTPPPPPAKPDYISVIVAPDNVVVGATFNIIVNTANTGSAPATALSTTQFNITGQPPLLFSIPPLGIGGSAANTTTATCPNYATTLYLRSFADLYNQTGESDRTNNLDTDTVNCYVQSNLPNYVPNITAPQVAFVNYPFQANFTTRNTGTAAATSPSTTRAAFQTSIAPSTVDFTVPALQAGQQQTDSATFICSSIGAKVLTETVDYFNNISESNENDNSQSKQVSCYPEPANCTLSFVNHAPQFSQNDFAQVRATCFAGMMQTACPPFLWQQNAAGGSMSPQNTNASLHPESTLILSSAPMPQIARKVNATSTAPFLNLYCELPFDVAEGAIGPDYKVTSITSAPLRPALLGEDVHFTVEVSNIGNVNATNDSISTATFSSGCVPVNNKDSYNLPPIPAQGHNLNSELACTCTAPGLQSVTVFANPTHAQWETNFDNNNLTYTFPCQTVVQRTCSDFI